MAADKMRPSLKLAASKFLFMTNNVYVILGSVLLIIARQHMLYCDTTITQSDEDLYLLVVLGCIGFIACTFSLFIDCTGKRCKTLICLVLWHSFVGICLILSLSNIMRKFESHQEDNMEFVVSVIYITFYITLCLAEAFYLFKENRKHECAEKDSSLIHELYIV